MPCCLPDALAPQLHVYWGLPANSVQFAIVEADVLAVRLYDVAVLGFLLLSSLLLLPWPPDLFATVVE